MPIRTFRPHEDGAAVMQLWDRCLGQQYPVTERVFRQATYGRANYEPEDAVVAVDGDRVVGFAMIELLREGAKVRDHAAVSAVLVDGDHRRKGLARRMLQPLEQSARDAGATYITAGAGKHRFWTGVPTDLAAAQAFFQSQGYQAESESVDLVVPLGNFAAGMKYQHRLAAIGAWVEPATWSQLAAVMAFEIREFPNWAESMIRMIAAGDLGNVLVVRTKEQIVGTIQTFTPQSRWRAANLIWESIHGEKMGGYGAVGIGEAFRGKGLGGAMCEAAALHVERSGATCAYIDWTNLEDFYGKVGAKTWRRFKTCIKKF
jgi:GNAT superfamily N-acetyltransferase